MKLYKYMPWKPFDEKDNLIEKYYTQENLLNSQLYFSSVTAFNDPFDLNPYLEVNYSYDELLIKAIPIVMNKDHIPFDQALTRAKYLIDSQGLDTKEGLQIAKNNILKLFTKVGVCCFTFNDPEKVLMWSHYGDQHYGICLCFEFHDDFSDHPPCFDTSYKISTPLKVTYSKKRHIYDPIGSSTEELETILKTKSDDWNYEEEYRIICFDHCGPIKYNPLFLTGIVAGCRMKDREKNVLIRLIENSNFLSQLTVAQMNPQEFRLEIKNI